MPSACLSCNAQVDGCAFSHWWMLGRGWGDEREGEEEGGGNATGFGIRGMEDKGEERRRGEEENLEKRGCEKAVGTLGMCLQSCATSERRPAAQFAARNV